MFKKTVVSCTAALFLQFFYQDLSAFAESLPADVSSALSEIEKLDPLQLELEFSGLYRPESGGTGQAVSSTASYLRDGDQFAWVTEAALLSGPDKHEFRFDGDVVSRRSGTATASWYKVANLITAQPDAGNVSIPYFEAVGICYPNTNKELRGGRLQSNILRLIESGGDLVSCGDSKLDGDDVIRVEIIADDPAWMSRQEDVRLELQFVQNNSAWLKAPQESTRMLEEKKESIPKKLKWIYYLSRENRFAVIKHERLTMDDQALSTYLNSSFQPISATQVVLARKVESRSFERIGQYTFAIEESPTMRHDISIAKASTESIAPSHFMLDRSSLTPGATVIDAVTPGLQNEDGTVVAYQMPASPDDLDSVISSVTGKNTGNKSNLLLILLALNAVVIAAFIVYRIYSVKKSAG